MSAADILKLIENVDPSDTAKLDEIDARVWCLINGYKAHIHGLSDSWHFQYEIPPMRGLKFGTVGIDAQKYTRSRDALKAIRPDKWDFICCPKRCSAHGPYVTYEEPDNGYVENIQLDSPEMPTEELAELHAVIQAIEYERSK